MESKNNHQIILGALIGGVIGGAALYLMKAAKDKPTLSKIGDILSEVGEIIDKDRDREEALEEIEKTIPKGDNAVNQALTLIATGIALWKKFKKGM